MASLLDCALLYASKLQWPVFPCAPRQKRPATQHGCLDATLDEDKIKWWWTRTPNANIAIATGKPSGVYVIDVDYDRQAGTNGYIMMFEWFRIGMMPKTPCQFTPRGGCHLLLKNTHWSPIQSTQSTKYFPGIDVRGEGGYILVAPSIVRNNHYFWNPRRHPLKIPLAPFPEWIRPAGKASQQEQSSSEVSQFYSSRTCNEPTAEIIDRARRYLGSCDPAVQGARGHDKLLWAATALVHGFCLDGGTAYKLLEETYNPTCVPPWNLNNPQDYRDFTRKIREAERMPSSRPRGWLLT